MATANNKKKRSATENQREYLDNYKKFKAGKLSGNEQKYLSNQEGVRKLPKSQRDQVKKANSFASSTKKIQPRETKGDNTKLASFVDDLNSKPPKDLYELQQRYPKAKPPKGTSSADTDDYSTNPPKNVYELQQRMEDKKKKKKTYPDRRFVD